MVSDYTFYKNPKTGEVRVALEIADNKFAVYKHINDKVHTCKIWTGSLQKAEATWNTKRFTPTPIEIMKYTGLFKLAFEDAIDTYIAFMTRY